MRSSIAYQLAGYGMTETIAAINGLNLGAGVTEKLFETIAKEAETYHKKGFIDGSNNGFSEGWDAAAETFG